VDVSNASAAEFSCERGLIELRRVAGARDATDVSNPPDPIGFQELEKLR
jgi:hypothetical protein